MNRSVSVQASCEDSGRSYSNTVLNDQAYLDPTTATDRLLKAGQWKQSLHKNRKNHKTSVSGLNRSNFRFSIGEAIPKLKAIEERWRPISREWLGCGRPPIGKQNCFTEKLKGSMAARGWQNYPQNAVFSIQGRQFDVIRALNLLTNRLSAVCAICQMPLKRKPA